MKMVVTLRNGVQIKTDVEDFTTGESSVGGELRSLKWTLSDVLPNSVIKWLDISQVAAVHAEHEPGDKEEAR